MEWCAFNYWNMCCFRLWPVPTRNEQPKKRQVWKNLINRVDTSSKKLLSPSKDQRVCSRHFTDGQPTQKNPYPTEALGYPDFKKKVGLIGSTTIALVLSSSLDNSPPGQLLSTWKNSVNKFASLLKISRSLMCIRLRERGVGDMGGKIRKKCVSYKINLMHNQQAIQVEPSTHSDIVPHLRGILSSLLQRHANTDFCLQ